MHSLSDQEPKVQSPKMAESLAGMSPHTLLPGPSDFLTAIQHQLCVLYGNRPCPCLHALSHSLGIPTPCSALCPVLAGLLQGPSTKEVSLIQVCIFTSQLEEIQLLEMVGTQVNEWVSEKNYNLCFLALCCAVLSHSVVSNSLQPHGLQSARLLHSWDSPGKNTVVGCHSLLQGNVSNLGTEPGSPALQVDSLPSKAPRKPLPCFR